MTEYDPADERPLDIDWEDTKREGQVWVSVPIATTTLEDGSAEIRLAIKHDDEWVFWAELWTDEAPHEPISDTTYATEGVEGMLSALSVIRDSVEKTFGDADDATDE